MVIEFDDYLMNVGRTFIDLLDDKNCDKSGYAFQKLRRHYRSLRYKTSERSKVPKNVIEFFYAKVARGETPLKASDSTKDYIGNGTEFLVKIKGNPHKNDFKIQETLMEEFGYVFMENIVRGDMKRLRSIETSFPDIMLLSAYDKKGNLSKNMQAVYKRKNQAS